MYQLLMFNRPELKKHSEFFFSSSLSILLCLESVYVCTDPSLKCKSTHDGSGHHGLTHVPSPCSVLVRIMAHLNTLVQRPSWSDAVHGRESQSPKINPNRKKKNTSLTEQENNLKSFCL